MSSIKEYQERLDQEKAAAEEIAIETGYLKKCDYCDTIYDAGGVDPEHAFKRANQLITDKDPRVEIFGGNRKKLGDLLKDLLSGHPPTCACDKQS